MTTDQPASNVTKLPRSGRGGPRPGSGRPRNLPATPANTAEVERIGATGATAGEMARAHAARVVAVLLQIAESGINEAARVQAAKALASMGDEAAAKTPPAKPELTENERNWNELIGA